ncbi:hypothetical protein NKG05_14550 [Oerskovia sp. M15]
MDADDVLGLTVIVFGLYAFVAGSIHVVSGFGVRSVARELAELRSQAQAAGVVVTGGSVLGAGPTAPVVAEAAAEPATETTLAPGPTAELTPGRRHRCGGRDGRRTRDRGCPARAGGSGGRGTGPRWAPRARSTHRPRSRGFVAIPTRRRDRRSRAPASGRRGPGGGPHCPSAERPAGKCYNALETYSSVTSRTGAVSPCGAGVTTR